MNDIECHTENGDVIFYCDNQCTHTGTNGDVCIIFKLNRIKIPGKSDCKAKVIRVSWIDYIKFRNTI